MFYTGMICLWYGDLHNIPAGVRLCDGSLGTPDLRDRFPKCVTPPANPGNIGGSTTHVHGINNYTHSHPTTSDFKSVSGSAFSPSIGNNIQSFDTKPGSSMPPYFSLYYIMKV